jgi:hypothetical protein
MSNEVVYTCKCCGFEYKIKLQEFFGQPWVDGWVLNVKGDWTCYFCQLDLDLTLPITLTTIKPTETGK